MPFKLLSLMHLHILINFIADKCSLCYDSATSLPGFMLNPNNCQKFYMCVPNKDGSFTAHDMTCPDCLFWDDDKLTCVEVDTSCRVSVSVPTGTPNPFGKRIYNNTYTFIYI